MSSLPVYRPPNPPARRSGILLLVLAGLALLIGVAMFAAGLNLSALAQSPEMRDQLDEIRRRLDVDPKYVFLAAGVMAIAYALAAAVLGLLVRGGGTAVVVLTLVFVALAGGLSAINTLTAAFSGQPAALVMPAVLTIVHGMLVRWLIQALARSASATTTGLPVPSHLPLRDYYRPPLPPPPSAM